MLISAPISCSGPSFRCCGVSRPGQLPPTIKLPLRQSVELRLWRASTKWPRGFTLIGRVFSGNYKQVAAFNETFRKMRRRRRRWDESKAKQKQWTCNKIQKKKHKKKIAVLMLRASVRELHLLSCLLGRRVWYIRDGWRSADINSSQRTTSSQSQLFVQLHNSSTKLRNAWIHCKQQDHSRIIYLSLSHTLFFSLFSSFCVCPPWR